LDENTGDHQYGFWHNRSTTHQIFCIHQVLVKKMEVQWDNTSSDHRLQERLWFSVEGRNAQYSQSLEYP
jgi:DNA mismatch repair protein MutH